MQLPDDTIHLHWLARPAGSGREPLRQVLAAYLGCAPDAVDIVQADHSSKPRLAGRELHFNWSHSRELAVVALARHLEVGVDLEFCDRKVHALALAERFFAPEESAWLQRQPRAQRTRAFLELWTGKEAVLKAVGRGLGGLDEVAFEPAPGSDTLHLKVPDEAHFTRSLQLARPTAAHVDALLSVAWLGAPCRLAQFRQFTPLDAGDGRRCEALP